MRGRAAGDVDAMEKNYKHYLQLLNKSMSYHQ